MKKLLRITPFDVAEIELIQDKGEVEINAQSGRFSRYSLNSGIYSISEDNRLRMESSDHNNSLDADYSGRLLLPKSFYQIDKLGRFGAFLCLIENPNGKKIRAVVQRQDLLTRGLRNLLSPFIIEGVKFSSNGHGPEMVEKETGYFWQHYFRD